MTSPAGAGAAQELAEQPRLAHAVLADEAHRGERAARPRGGSASSHSRSSSRPVKGTGSRGRLGAGGGCAARGGASRARAGGALRQRDARAAVAAELLPAGDDGAARAAHQPTSGLEKRPDVPSIDGERRLERGRELLRVLVAARRRPSRAP